MTQLTCVFNFEKPEDLHQAIASGCRIIQDAQAAGALLSQIAPPENGLLLFISTRNTYHKPLSSILAKEIQMRYSTVSTEMLHNVQTALHEALSNAVIHGSLQLPKAFFSADQLSQCDNRLMHKLEQEAYASLAIAICIEMVQNDENLLRIEVINQGKGFNSEEALEKARAISQSPLPARHHGMGLPLVMKLANHVDFLRGGLSFEMIFRLDDSPQQLTQKTSFSAILSDSLHAASILVIDDREFSRHIINDILLTHGFHNRIMVHDGHTALTRILDEQPQLILCNLQLATPSPTALCCAIRSRPETVNIPIIFHSTMTSIDERIALFRAGANDIIEHPLNGDEVALRLEMHLSRYLAFQKLHEYRARVENELELARQMHLALIPQPEALNHLGKKHALDITSYFQPSSEIGGDIWGVFNLSDDCLGIYLCDFTGHGVSAAINTFRFHTALSGITDKENPGLFLGNLNRLLHEMLPANQFATFFYACIHQSKDQLSFAAAGSPKPLHFSAANGTATTIDSSGLPLGILPDYTYETQYHPYQKGDSLFFYSDALLETPCNNGDVLSEELLLNTLCKHMHSADAKTGQKALTRELLNMLGTFDGRQCSDDLTLCILSRLQ